MAGLGTAFAEAFATDNFWLLVLGVLLAGLVRGFSGFGTAMVYLPFAGQVLSPVWTVVTLLVIDLLGPLPAVPRALRDGHPRDVLRLGAGALVGLPLGVLILATLPPEPFRLGVSALTLALLVCLVAGLRWQGSMTGPMIYATGGLAGVLGGALGLAGPPVILLYMARPLPVSAIRANTLLFLLLTDALMIGVVGLNGLLSLAPLVIGLCLALPYLAAVMVGSAIFDPRHAKVYRWVAYAIIAGSALSGLPVFD